MEEQTFDSGFPIPSGVPVTAQQRDWPGWTGVREGEDHSVKASSSGKVVDREKNKRTL